MLYSPILSKCSLLSKSFLYSILSPFIIKDCLKEFRYCRVVREACVLKLSIFVVQKLALHQNGVEFRQQSIGNIRISPATSKDVVRRRTMLLENWLITHTHTHAHTKPCIEAARCLKRQRRDCHPR